MHSTCAPRVLAGVIIALWLAAPAASASSWPMAGGRRQISHGGEVSGFTAENDVYPDEKTSVMRLPADGIGPLGAPSSFTQAAQSLRGGMVFRRFTVAARGRTLSVTAFYMPDGKIEQFLVMPAD